MIIKINSKATNVTDFTATYNTDELHATVKFEQIRGLKERQGTLIKFHPRNKRCESIPEFLDLVSCLEANHSTSHLDIH
jgi:hypothetical protein